VKVVGGSLKLITTGGYLTTISVISSSLAVMGNLELTATTSSFGMNQIDVGALYRVNNILVRLLWLGVGAGGEGEGSMGRGGGGGANSSCRSLSTHCKVSVGNSGASISAVTIRGNWASGNALVARSITTTVNGGSAGVTIRDVYAIHGTVTATMSNFGVSSHFCLLKPLIEPPSLMHTDTQSTLSASSFWLVISGAHCSRTL
jgi:hypothetical protein